jgi:hypothetical protein
MDEAAPEEGPAAEKKRPLLRRIPTPLIVTLVGIVLTAWLLPAFTRQWDDRQKAHEIKAALATQIAAATADAVTRSNVEARLNDARSFRKAKADPGYWSRISGTPLGENLDAHGRLYDMWLRYRIAIEANLRANFDSETVIAALHRYSEAMGDLIHIAAGGTIVVSEVAPDIPLTSADKRVLAYWKVEDGNYFPTSVVGEALLRGENKFIAEVLAAHVQGYSTTTHDLIRDLIP